MPGVISCVGVSVGVGVNVDVGNGVPDPVVMAVTSTGYSYIEPPVTVTGYLMLSYVVSMELLGSV